jgi:hypothetical protein
VTCQPNISAPNDIGLEKQDWRCEAVCELLDEHRRLGEGEAMVAVASSWRFVTLPSAGGRFGDRTLLLLCASLPKNYANLVKSRNTEMNALDIDPGKLELAASFGATDVVNAAAVDALAAWTDDDIASYTAAHDPPVHPLLARGYRSIGCAPTTRAVKPGEDPRSGRWSDSEKTECGLHS